VPTGKVKWYSAEKGFGFITSTDGQDVYVRAGALPEGTEALRAGQRVEFGVADGKRGPQALTVTLLSPPARRGAAPRPEAAPREYTPEQLNSMIGDMINLLEETVQPSLRAGHFPDRKHTQHVSEVLRAIARALDV
jgi:CspA family cold shock protein